LAVHPERKSEVASLNLALDSMMIGCEGVVVGLREASVRIVSGCPSPLRSLAAELTTLPFAAVSSVIASVN